jgi:urease accessory protein
MTRSAKLHLRFQLGDAGSTILRVQQQEPPWRVVRGFQTASGETLAHLHNVSGGILAGDDLEWRVDVEARAQAQVTSTGATRIYRSRSGQTAAQRATVNIGEGGYLEYLPDQLIPFAGSRFQQTTHVELGANASLIWWDLVAPGREASGEVFQYDSLASFFQITAGGEPVVIEKWTLEPLIRPLDSPARLGPFRYFSSCYVCRAGESAAYWQALESQLQRVAEHFDDPDVLWGITSLRAHGLAIRGLAKNGRALSADLVELWKAAKWSLCGRVATPPRKIH